MGKLSRCSRLCGQIIPLGKVNVDAKDFQYLCSLFCSSIEVWIPMTKTLYVMRINFSIPVWSVHTCVIMKRQMPKWQ